MSTQIRESLISVDEARNIIFRHVHELETEFAGVINALGKTIAEDIVADSDIPAFANAAVEGFEMRKGERILAKGTLIGPAQMGILAALGKPGIAVNRKPKAAIITTGSEYVDIVDDLAAGQFRNSNRYSLIGHVLSAGCEIGPLLHARDGKDSIISAIEKGAKADVIITARGTSLGENEVIREVLGLCGQVHISSVAMKPGKAFCFATVQDKPVFALPGSPIQSAAAFEVMARPALLKMQGRTILDRPIITAALKNSVNTDFCYRQFLPAKTVWEGGAYSTEIIGDQDTSRLKSMAKINSIAIVREDREDLQLGNLVEVMLFDPCFQT